MRYGHVNLGGDIKVIGPRPDGSPWRIGIRHPRRPGALIQTVALRRGGLASSGDYERCIMLDGVRYGHILNPKTGWPVRHLASVSVVGDLCVVAGSASTIAMLKDAGGPAWLKGVGLPHFWVDVHGEAGGSLAAPDSTEGYVSAQGRARDAPACERAGLYLSVFLTGGAVMVIELLGTRIIAPFYGVSLYVWSSLISVALIALAIGYSPGGRWADRAKRTGLSLVLDSGNPDASTQPDGPAGSASPLCWQFSSSPNMVSSMNWITGLPSVPAMTSLIWTK